MVEGKWFPPGTPIDPALVLRREIFSMDRDEIDAYAWQALAILEGKPVATGRIWWKDGAFHIGMIGVKPDYRHMGYGDFVTRLLIFKAQQHNALRILLLAPPSSASFFRRYGFLKSGEPDHDGLIPHELSGDDLLLAGCASKQAKESK